MAKLIALYKHPKDVSQFDAYYKSTHAPLAKKIPGLRRYEVSTGPVNTPQGPAPYYKVAVLEFDSMEALGKALGSPEGQAAAGDIPKFATGGAELFVMDMEPA